MGANFLSKGESKVNFVQSTLRNNSFLPALLPAFSEAVAEPVKTASTKWASGSLEQLLEISACVGPHSTRGWWRSLAGLLHVHLIGETCLAVIQSALVISAFCTQ